ncbi:phage tail protein (plasmid) [Kitasatospora sp. NBC_00070]|uniref:phage tail protein n=1 Tax=Kitasatospora sp. NBC_00070 TaxID=2975962 RepID=UPI002F916974
MTTSLPAPSRAGLAEQHSLGLTMRFQVILDEGIDLGLWKSCKGLNVSFKSKPLYEGGNYESPVAMLAEQIEYSAVTLQRAISGPDSRAVQKWLKDRARGWMSNPRADYRGSTAKIILADAALQEVATWTLHGVYPSKWSGPDLDAMGTGAVALETLELIHQGFL